MLISTRLVAHAVAVTFLLHNVSCKPPPVVNARNPKGQRASTLRLGNQILADDDSCITNYNPKDIVMPEFASYDEKKAKVFRYRKQISVNLGSWFVQENWMNPSLVRCASGSKSAELDVASGWDNPTSARSALEKHWDTWIKEDDFAWLANIGVNTVRLPIGYWSLGPKYCQGTPFQEVASVYERSWPRVLRAVEWAAKYNIGVLVDLHGAVGSQNGQSHAGTSDGQMHLFDNDENMKKTTDVLVYLTKQLVPISNVVGIQILNEPRNVDSLPEFYGRTIDTLRQLSPDAAKFPFYIHDGFNLGRFATFVGGRKDFVVQDHHSYFVFTPSDSSTSAKQHTSNINNGISSSLAAASKQARGNLVVDEWSCALTPESLSSLSSDSKQLAVRKSFCTSQANVYLRKTAGWSFWSYKTENCDNEDGWCFRKAVGRSLPAEFSVWDGSNAEKPDSGKKYILNIAEEPEDAMGNSDEDLSGRSLSRGDSRIDTPVHVNFGPADKTYIGSSQTVPLPKGPSDNSETSISSKLTHNAPATHVHSSNGLSERPNSAQNTTNALSGKSAGGDPSISDQDSAPSLILDDADKDLLDDQTVPHGTPAPDVDDMMAASIVPNNAQPSFDAVGKSGSVSKEIPTSSLKRMFGIDPPAVGSGSTAARRVAQVYSIRSSAETSLASRSSPQEKGHDDGYAAAVTFNEFEGSRLGFATQYMEDSIVALLASGALQRGKEGEYRNGFMKGLEDGETKIMKDMKD